MEVKQSKHRGREQRRSTSESDSTKTRDKSGNNMEGKSEEGTDSAKSVTEKRTPAIKG